jgi:hypothetical protein
MNTRIAFAATLLTTGLLGGMIAGTAAGVTPAVLADGPTPTAVFADAVSLRQPAGG